MGNERNLQELLAAINSGDGSPASSRGFPISPAQATIPPAAPQAQPSQMQQPNAAHPAAQYNNNYHELVNLLGEPAAQQPTIPQPPAHRNIPIASYQNQNSAMGNSTQYSQHQQNPAAAHKPPQPAAAARKPQTQAQAHPSAVSQAHRAQQQKRQSARMDITAELQQVIADRQPTHAQATQSSQNPVAAAAAVPAQSRSRAQQLTAAQRQAMAAAAARQGAIQQQSGRVPNTSAAQARTANATPQQLAAAAAFRARNRQITQEQVIVGHFCRHSIKTLSRVMQGNPNAQQTEARLKEHIRVVWAQWVRGVITRTQLLDSVANFVRSTCPEAANIDVVREFKSWYEREFEMQRQRTTNMDHANAAARPGMAQRARPAQPGQQPQAQMQAMNARSVQQLPVKSTTTAVKQEVAAVAPPPAKPSVMKAKQEATLNHSSTAGKTLAATVPTAGRPGVGRGGGASGKTAASKAAAVKAAAAKVGAGRGIAGKSVAGKTVGGKGVTRTPPGPKVDPHANRVPNTAAIPQAAAGPAAMGDTDVTQAGRPRVAGKTLSGLAKTPTGKKKSAATKVSPKGSQGKSAKGSPVSAGRGKPLVTPTDPSASVAKPAVGDKRLATELSVGSSGSASPASKKPKPVGKVIKAPPPRPKIGITSDNEPLVKGVKPPPGKIDISKKAGPVAKKPPPGVPGGTTPSTAQAQKQGTGAGPPTAAGTSTAAGGEKKIKRVDDELAVTNGLVDVEAEEDKMGLGTQDDGVIFVEDNAYSEDMVLVGTKLRAKMQKIMKRFELNDSIGKDIMEMVSLAVEERLRLIVEGLKESAQLRTEAHKEAYITENVGVNVYEKMEQMREEEDRSLVNAAEMRVKKLNEQKEQELRKVNGEASGTEKKKETNATSEAERKEKLAQEKKRKEHSSQRDALSGLLAGIDKRRKKPNSKGLAPLAPLGGLEPLGKGKGLASLPPIQKRGPDSFGSSKDRALGKLEKLKALAPLTKVGRNAAKEKDGETQAPVPRAKEPLKLVDVIFFLENEVNSRKSALLYKWYARLGVTN